MWKCARVSISVAPCLSVTVTPYKAGGGACFTRHAGVASHTRSAPFFFFQPRGPHHRRPGQTLHITVNTSRPKVSRLTSAAASLLCCLETQSHERTWCMHAHMHISCMQIHQDKYVYTRRTVKKIPGLLSLPPVVSFLPLTRKHIIPLLIPVMNATILSLVRGWCEQASCHRNQ